MTAHMTTEHPGADELIRRLERIEVKDNDILLLEVQAKLSSAARRAIYAHFGEYQKKAGLSNVLLILADNGDCDLRKLPEVEMRRHGWMRAPSA